MADAKIRHNIDASLVGGLSIANVRSKRFKTSVKLCKRISLRFFYVLLRFHCPYAYSETLRKTEKCTRNLLTHLHPFSTPLKTSENLTVFWCFQGLEEGCIGSKCVNSFLANSLNVYPLKIPETFWFSVFFMGCKKRTLVRNRLAMLIF